MKIIVIGTGIVAGLLAHRIPTVLLRRDSAVCRPDVGRIARYAPLTYNPTVLRSPERLRVDSKIQRRET
jgi:hypothetical protein